jgi:hypothetical protein
MFPSLTTKIKLLPIPILTNCCPYRQKRLQFKDGVSIGPIPWKTAPRRSAFSTDISYAGTKIGEVFLAMDASGSCRIDHGVSF